MLLLSEADCERVDAEMNVEPADCGSLSLVQRPAEHETTRDITRKHPRVLGGAVPARFDEHYKGPVIIPSSRASCTFSSGVPS